MRTGHRKIILGLTTLLAGMALTGPEAWGQTLADDIRARSLRSSQTGGFTVPTPPDDHILDPEGLLDPERRERLARVLARAGDTHDLAVRFAIFPTLEPDEFPADRALLLREAWLQGVEHGGVLVFIEDSRRFAASVTPALRGMDKDARIEDAPDDYEQLLTRRPTLAMALREAATDFEFRLRNLMTREERRQHLKQPLLIALLVLGILAGILLLAVLAREMRAHNAFGKSRHFPRLRVQTRLGGKNCGGHLVVVRYNQNENKEQSHGP